VRGSQRALNSAVDAEAEASRSSPPAMPRRISRVRAARRRCRKILAFAADAASALRRPNQPLFRGPQVLRRPAQISRHLRPNAFADDAAVSIQPTSNSAAAAADRWFDLKRFGETALHMWYVSQMYIYMFLQ